MALFDPRLVPIVRTYEGYPPVPSDRLTAQGLRDFFQRTSAQEAPADQVEEFTGPPPRQAAVLVPVIQRAEPTVLLTQRTAHLRKHAGQIAFPGGKMDENDESPTATALRETEEEIGLPAAQLEVIGSLPRYSVTPV